MWIGNANWVEQDVANHQVRNLRTLLVDDTVNFERHLFRRRIENGQLDVRLARRWYERAQRDLGSWDGTSASGTVNNNHNSDNRLVAAFVRAMVDSLASSTRADFPDTFEFDRDRIHVLRWELQGMVALEVCIKRFELFVQEDLHRRDPIPAWIIRDLRAAFVSLMEDDHHDYQDEGSHEQEQQKQRSWVQQVDKLSLQMAHAVRQLSGGFYHHNHHHHHCRSWSVQRQQTVQRLEKHLRRDLAIGGDHRADVGVVPSGLWHHYEDLALRVLSAETLAQTVVFLGQPVLAAAQLATTTTITNSSTTTTTTTGPTPSHSRSNHHHHPLTSSTDGIHATSSSGLPTPSSSPSLSPPTPPSFEENLTDLARRLAHITSLHWRIFAPIVYLS